MKWWHGFVLAAIARGVMMINPVAGMVVAGIFATAIFGLYGLKLYRYLATRRARQRARGQPGQDYRGD